MNRNGFMKDCFGVYHGKCTEHPKCMKFISEEGSTKCVYCKCVPTFHKDVMQEPSTDTTGDMVNSSEPESSVVIDTPIDDGTDIFM